MANLKDLVVNGNARVVGTTYGTFNGSLTGNASTATSAVTAGTCTGNAATATTASGITDGVTIDCGTL